MTFRDRALALLEDAASPAEADVPIYRSDADAIAAAQVLATLELAEQQRIANRIALASTVAAVEMKYMQHGCRAHLLGETGLFDLTIDPEEALLKPEIKEGLGL